MERFVTLSLTLFLSLATLDAACPFKKVELASIQTVIGTACTLIQESGNARTAPKARAILKRNISQLKESVGRAEHVCSDDSSDFSFYEEEASKPKNVRVHSVWRMERFVTLSLTFFLSLAILDAACPFKKVELASIQTVIGTACTLIQESGNARTAPKAMTILKRNMSQLSGQGGTCVQ